MKDGRIRELFFQIFCELDIPLTLLNDAWISHPVLDTSQGKAQLPYGMSVPRFFEAQLYFQPLVLMSREASDKRLNTKFDVVNSRLVGLAVQQIQKAWDSLTKSSIWYHCGLCFSRTCGRIRHWSNSKC